MTLGFGSASLRKILVVDDCAEVRALMRKLLERPGLQVVDRGLHAGLRIAFAQNANYDLVVTNVPGPFIFLGLSVVYVAALPEPDNLACHCAASLNKPFCNDVFMSVVLKCLGDQTPPAKRPPKSEVDLGSQKARKQSA
jgi:hypothetical protein